jgi:hypothetical protein
VGASLVKIAIYDVLNFYASQGNVVLSGKPWATDQARGHSRLNLGFAANHISDVPWPWS